MSEHGARIVWERGDQVFVDNKFSRRHRWLFDGGADVIASSPPQIRPEPMSDPAGIDPEEAFVTALASCHMLWFLGIAAANGYCVNSYTDNPVGVLEAIGGGRQGMTGVTLRPHVTFEPGRQPAPEEVDAMHEKAHHNCFIANSVKSEVSCIPVFAEIDGRSERAA